MVSLLLFVLLAFGYTREAGAQQVYRLSLGDAARIASSQNASVEAARLRVNQAEAQVVQERSALLPQVSAGIQDAGRTFNTATLGLNFPMPEGIPPLLDPNGQVMGPVHTIDTRARVSQALFDVGALRRVDAANARVAVSEADVRSTSEAIASAAASAYLVVLQARAAYDARSADKALAEELVAIAQAQLKAGTGVDLDVTRAQAQLAATSAQLVAARNRSEQARLDLLRVLNLPLDSQIELTDSLTALADMPDSSLTPAGALALALENRLDLKAYQQRRAAAEAGIAAVKASRLPTITAVADLGVIGTNPTNALPTYDWGLQLSVPFLDGSRRRGRIEEQQAMIREVDVRYEDQLTQIRYEIQRASNDLTAAREQVEAAQLRLKLGTQEVAQAQQRFRSGVAGNAEVVTAMLSLSNARDMLVNALTSYHAARIGLARAEGIINTLP